MFRTPMMIDATIKGTTIIFSALMNSPPKKSKISVSAAPKIVVDSLATRPTMTASAKAMRICQCRAIPPDGLLSVVSWSLMWSCPPFE